MKLFFSPTSPFVRKVLVVAAEVGLTDRVELVTTNAFASEPALLHANPLSRVPALVRDDGATLFDSPVICEYLDHLSASNRGVFPAAGEARWRALRTQALADGIMDASVLLRLEQMRPEGERSPKWIDRQTAVVRRGLEALAADLASLEGPFTIGPITAGCALGYVDLRHSSLRWRDDHPRLADWFARAGARPSMASTAPPAG